MTDSTPKHYTEEEIKAMLEATSEGDWRYERTGEEFPDHEICAYVGGSEFEGGSYTYVAEAIVEESDARFIAAARDIIRQLLQENEELRKNLDIANGNF